MTEDSRPLSTGSVTLPIELPLHFEHEPARRTGAGGSRLAILLHGYDQRGAKIREPLRSALPEDCAILAPNGPFPMPRRRPGREEWRVGYSWYFYDTAKKRFAIDMEPAIALISAAILQLGHETSEKIVIGFSQGGWRAPALASRLIGVRQVIGVGCHYAVERTPPPLPFRVDAVHGERDEVVPFDGAKESHGRFVSMGGLGRFVSVPSAGHAFEPAIVEAVRELANANA